MSFALPPPETLRCFLAASEQLNFRAAARRVGLTPAALGQRIKQLEEQVGSELFHRTTRACSLTEVGLALVPYAERALDATADCLRIASGELPVVERDVVIGTRHELGLSWLVPMLPALEHAHPGVTFHFYFGAGVDLVGRVGLCELDCAVTSSRITDPKMASVQLHREDYALVGAPGYLSRTAFRSREDASKHILVDIDDALPLFRYWRDADGGIDSREFRAIRRMGTIAAIRDVVIRGQGVAVLPRYFVREDLRAKKLRKILPKVSANHDFFRLVFRSDDPRRSLYESIAGVMSQHRLS